MALVFIIASLFGILPIILWLVFFLWQDIKKPEPLQWLLILFGAGMLITPIVWYGENLFLKLIGTNSGNIFTALSVILAYGGIAVIEELGKFFSAYFILKKNKHFNEAVDAMVYLVVLALGFALVENILIVGQELVNASSAGIVFSAPPGVMVNGSSLQPILQIMSLRFIGANLLHALCSGIIGFFWAWKLLSKKNSYLYWGIFLGILLHAIFNIAIIKLGGMVIFFISLALFLAAACLLWAFDIMKKIRKPIIIK